MDCIGKLAPVDTVSVLYVPLSVGPVQLPELTDSGAAVDLHMCLHQIYCTILARPEQNRVRLKELLLLSDPHTYSVMNE